MDSKLTEHFIYVDGSLDSTTPDTTPADLTDAASFDMGNESAWPTAALNGLLDDVRVYRRALSAQEIRDLSQPRALFQRGDVNSDSTYDITDAVFLLNHLFLGGLTPSCRDAADANDDGGLDISDAVVILGYLFLGEGAPPAPFDDCSADPTTDALDCVSFPPCS